LPKPYAEHLQWWGDARYGMFIHWGPVAFTEQEISWSRANTNPKCPNQGPTSAEVYDNLYKKFNPVKKRNAEHSQQRDHRVVTASLASRGRAAAGDQVQRALAQRRIGRGECEAAIGTAARLRQLQWRAAAGLPQRHCRIGDRHAGTEHLAVQWGGEGRPREEDEAGQCRGGRS
jgi:hypothetical protein